jgi:uncharacterized protein YndB with AHSA1/START domain
MISASASTEIARPLGEVFQFVADPSNEPTWYTDMVTGRLEPAGEPGPGKVMIGRFKAFGRESDATADVTVFEPNRRMVYAYRAPAFGLKPTPTYIFEPTATGTRFTRQVEAEPVGLMRLMAGQLKTRNASFVQNLKGRLESV